MTVESGSTRAVQPERTRNVAHLGPSLPPGDPSDHRCTETIPMQTAHAYAGSLNGRDIGEIVRVEESSLILIVRSNRVAFKDGQQSRHRASIVCESERALTWIDFFALRIATDWRIACSSLSCSAGDELALVGAGEKGPFSVSVG